MKKIVKNFLLLFISSLILIDCGGGGGSSSSEEPPIVQLPNFNVNTWPGSIWQVADPARANMDNSKLQQALDYAFVENRNTQAVVVIRHGVIVAEKYSDDKNRFSLATSWSTAKSFTSALIGMVIDQGLISSVDDKACLYLSDWDCDEVVCLSLDCPKARSEISIRDLLEMRSGLEDENIGGMSIYSSTDNQLFFALNRLAVKTRGTEFLYSNSDSMILSGILENTTGMTVKELAERDLFSTIGMTGDWWSDKEGHTMTYCCIDATSRDFARFGLLFARNGMWEDTQVITQEWVTESTSPAEGLSYYGLHWWVYPVSMISSGKANMFAAQGLHTNDIWINQPLDLVVVRNSDFTRYGTDSIRTGSNIHSTNPPDSWDNTEFLTYITDSINQ